MSAREEAGDPISARVWRTSAVVVIGSIMSILDTTIVNVLSGAHTVSGAAAAYGTAFWFSAGMTALAIIPCVILMRAERAARARKRAAAQSSTETMTEAMAA